MQGRCGWAGGEQECETSSHWLLTQEGQADCLLFEVHLHTEKQPSYCHCEWIWFNHPYFRMAACISASSRSCCSRPHLLTQACRHIALLPVWITDVKIFIYSIWLWKLDAGIKHLILFLKKKIKGCEWNGIASWLPSFHHRSSRNYFTPHSVLMTAPSSYNTDQVQKETIRWRSQIMSWPPHIKARGPYPEERAPGRRC